VWKVAGPLDVSSHKDRRPCVRGASAGPATKAIERRDQSLWLGDDPDGFPGVMLVTNNCRGPTAEMRSVPDHKKALPRRRVAIAGARLITTAPGPQAALQS
jgi:hypothetical protein